MQLLSTDGAPHKLLRSVRVVLFDAQIAGPCGWRRAREIQRLLSRHELSDVRDCLTL